MKSTFYAQPLVVAMTLFSGIGLPTAPVHAQQKADHNKAPRFREDTVLKTEGEELAITSTLLRVRRRPSIDCLVSEACRKRTI